MRREREEREKERGRERFCLGTCGAYSTKSRERERKRREIDVGGHRMPNVWWVGYHLVSPSVPTYLHFSPPYPACSGYTHLSFGRVRRHAHDWGTSHNRGGGQGDNTASTAQLLSESIIEVATVLIFLFFRAESPVGAVCGAGRSLTGTTNGLSLGLRAA